MASNMLTTKEATLISDLLTFEECATKKAKIFSKTLTDKKLAENFSVLAENHQKRFNALMELL